MPKNNSQLKWDIADQVINSFHHLDAGQTLCLRWILSILYAWSRFYFTLHIIYRQSYITKPKRKLKIYLTARDQGLFLSSQLLVFCLQKYIIY